MARKKKDPPVMAAETGVIAIGKNDAAEVAEINRGNKLTVAVLRRNILDSGLLELVVRMALTGREYFVSTEGEIIESDEMLSQQARLSLINKIIDKSISTPKDEVEEEKEDDGMSRWHEIGKTLAEGDE